MAEVGCCVGTQIKILLVEHGHMDVVVACVKSCVQGGLAWVAAALSLELLRKGSLDVSRPLTLCFASPVERRISRSHSDTGGEALAVLVRSICGCMSLHFCTLSPSPVMQCLAEQMVMLTFLVIRSRLRDPGMCRSRPR